MPKSQIPYKSLQTIFLDVGNTLVSMDFDWLRAKLKDWGITCETTDLQRAEAAARPIVSAALEKLMSTENEETTIFYIRNILRRFNPASSLTDEEHDKIINKLLNFLKAPGRTERLWSKVLPGVREALEILKDRGLQLAVISNATGTVEQILINLRLEQYFDKIHDSHLVGFEKPDPRLFYHALEASGADPESSLHIGDLYHVDVIGAWSAGLHAVLLDPFGDWEDVDCQCFTDLFEFASSYERQFPRNY